MSKIKSYFIIISLIIFVVSAIPLFAQTKGLIYFVSTTGNDEWSGTLPVQNADKTDGPFATLERARDAILSLKQNEDLPDGGVTIYLREGIYSLSKTFKLETEDSGTPESPITFRAYRNEKVHLIGGKEIAGFKPVENPELLNRLQETIRTKVVQMDLRAQGVTNYGALTPRGFGRPIVPAGLELFFQGKPMTLARWPNNDFVRIAGVPAGPSGGKFSYSSDRPLCWKNKDDIWVHGYWTWDWAESYEKIKSIDTERREITTCEPHGVYGYKEGKRFYFLNILEEIDEPGEWYLDRTTGILYFYPPSPIDESKAFCSILETPLIVMENALLSSIG
ncbi:MAG: hypothetical protein M1426_02635, partial [Patescibacteria group bacterium]|nr:hypothetical protein [Patescibacteria group bacterium]